MRPVLRQTTVFILFIGGLILTTSTLTACGIINAYVSQLQPPDQTLDQTAPDFTLTTLQGETYTLSQLRGKIVVLNFWASWAGPSLSEVSELEAIWQKYRNHAVIVIGIAYVDTEKSVRAFITQYGLTYPVGLDVGAKISESYQIQGVPETFIIDQHGNIAGHIIGATTQRNLPTLLDKLLGRS